MTAAEKIVSQALFGMDQIKGEPDNYYLHSDAFLAAVERAINEEREACAKIADAAAETAKTLGSHPIAKRAHPNDVGIMEAASSQAAIEIAAGIRARK